ncbi:hypothetical protein K470DRAFT_258216 [Piedraia hortae CBS 480.64]|uniref:Uncharacterized protein n=1 Tax=Piedraia hortae CBS 480.64 TaxID=1314780 RepID=A0A6A7BZX2_9PEZI|nr:hypothetical protein K470DRAFT_258216 [Piedraia hortae CBS 480.64]
MKTSHSSSYPLIVGTLAVEGSANFVAMLWIHLMRTGTTFIFKMLVYCVRSTKFFKVVRCIRMGYYPRRTLCRG